MQLLKERPERGNVSALSLLSNGWIVIEFNVPIALDAQGSSALSPIQFPRMIRALARDHCSLGILPGGKGFCLTDTVADRIQTAGFNHWPDIIDHGAPD